jgi:hypothetical protein
MRLTHERSVFLQEPWPTIGSVAEPIARSGAEIAARFPRTPRWIGLLLLASSVTILLYPETRTSLRAAVWRELWAYV